MNDPRISRSNTDLSPMAQAVLDKPDLKSDVERIRSSHGVDLTAIIDPRADLGSAVLVNRLKVKINGLRAAMARGVSDPEDYNALSRIEEHLTAIRPLTLPPGATRRSTKHHRRLVPARA